MENYYFTRPNSPSGVLACRQAFKIKHTDDEHQIYTKPTMTPPREMEKLSP
jgi:hypothetical protein